MTMEMMNASEYSKRKLLLAAIKLFSEQGIEGVSLREINREAGTKNNSALHYHFGNKEGLVEAVSQFIQDWFEQARKDQIEKLEAINKAEVKEILEAFVSPYINLMQQEEWGYHAVRFLAKMEMEPNPDIHKLMNKHGKKTMTRFKDLLEKALPELPKKELLQRFNFFITSVMHGLADYENLKYSYVGNLHVSLKNLGKTYVQYSAAGFEAPKT